MPEYLKTKGEINDAIKKKLNEALDKFTKSFVPSQD